MTKYCPTNEKQMNTAHKKKYCAKVQLQTVSYKRSEPSYTLDNMPNTISNHCLQTMADNYHTLSKHAARPPSTFLRSVSLPWLNENQCKWQKKRLTLIGSFNFGKRKQNISVSSFRSMNDQKCCHRQPMVGPNQLLIII